MNSAPAANSRSIEVAAVVNLGQTSSDVVHDCPSVHGIWWICGKRAALLWAQSITSSDIIGRGTSGCRKQWSFTSLLFRSEAVEELGRCLVHCTHRIQRGGCWWWPEIPLITNGWRPFYCSNCVTALVSVEMTLIVVSWSRTRP